MAAIELFQQILRKRFIMLLDFLILLKKQLNRLGKSSQINLPFMGQKLLSQLIARMSDQKQSRSSWILLEQTQKLYNIWIISAEANRLFLPYFTKGSKKYICQHLLMHLNILRVKHMILIYYQGEYDNLDSIQLIQLLMKKTQNLSSLIAQLPRSQNYNAIKKNRISSYCQILECSEELFCILAFNFLIKKLL
ncbi:unnamed protein product [Paramecium sonneborni]|uniref:Uncharacterized protein n=1 Tax=Paramecium sonneborni TaxID=65129 RepID=A0A8S1M2F7_9CILI|nr:unnamed protein product [Paramecium sonneborni]